MIKQIHYVLALLLCLTAATASYAQIYQTSDAQIQGQQQKSLFTPSTPPPMSSSALINTSSMRASSFGGCNSRYSTTLHNIGSSGVHYGSTPIVMHRVEIEQGENGGEGEEGGDTNINNPDWQPIGPIPFIFMLMLVCALTLHRRSKQSLLSKNS